MRQHLLYGEHRVARVAGVDVVGHKAFGDGRVRAEEDVERRPVGHAGGLQFRGALEGAHHGIRVVIKHIVRVIVEVAERTQAALQA